MALLQVRILVSNWLHTTIENTVQLKVGTNKTKCMFSKCLNPDYIGISTV